MHKKNDGQPQANRNFTVVQGGCHSTNFTDPFESGQEEDGGFSIEQLNKIVYLCEVNEAYSEWFDEFNHYVETPVDSIFDWPQVDWIMEDLMMDVPSGEGMVDGDLFPSS